MGEAVNTAHVDSRWCADLHCSKCYSSDTWQKAEIERLRVDNAALRAALEAEADRVSVPVGWQFRYACGEDGYGPWQFTSDEHDASVYENNVSYETRRVYSLAAHERARDES